MKKPSAKARGKVERPKPFEKSKKVDFSKFKAVPSASDIAKLAWAGAGAKLWPVSPPIQVLSPAKTVGLGRTYLELQIHGFADFRGFGFFPYVHWEADGQSGGSAVVVYFEPGAYGITSVANYVTTFNIHLVTKATFSLWGTGMNVADTIALQPGYWTLQVLLRNISPANSFYTRTYLAQETPRARWTWYSSVIKFPDIIVNDPTVHPGP
jgi:hypothetical protein